MIKYSENKKFAWIDGYRFCRDDKTGYYLSTQIKGNKRLHRYVWEKHNGAIPDGFHVHHKDHDKQNNDISNLEILSASEHSFLHGLELTEDQRQWRRNNVINNAMPAAKAWHSTAEGKEWHKKLGRISWENKKAKKHICEHCGKEYETKNSGRNKYCSNACSSAARRKSGVDNETRICEWCGKEYSVNKYSKSKTCSMSCRNYIRWDKERKKGRA